MSVEFDHDRDWVDAVWKQVLSFVEHVVSGEDIGWLVGVDAHRSSLFDRHGQSMHRLVTESSSCVDDWSSMDFDSD